MSIESVGFTSREGADLLSSASRNAARFLEGDLARALFGVGNGPVYTSEATELRLAEEIGTTEILCPGRGTTEIWCDEEKVGTTEIRCPEDTGTTEIRCDTDKGGGTTEIRCPEDTGTTEIRCDTTEIRCS